MRSQLYKQVTNTLNNKGWGDMRYYQDPMGTPDTLGVYLKQNGEIKKIGFPLFINFKGHQDLQTKRFIIAGSILAFILVFIVLIVTIVSLII